MSCMPTQMPRNGRPLPRTAVLQRLAHAGHGVEAALAVGEGADARQHDAVGGGDDVAGRRVTMISASASLSRAARSNALAAECRLPDP